MKHNKSKGNDYKYIAPVYTFEDFEEIEEEYPNLDIASINVPAPRNESFKPLRIRRKDMSWKAIKTGAQYGRHKHFPVPRRRRKAVPIRQKLTPSKDAFYCVDCAYAFKFNYGLRFIRKAV